MTARLQRPVRAIPVPPLRPKRHHQNASDRHIALHFPAVMECGGHAAPAALRRAHAATGTAAWPRHKTAAAAWPPHSGRITARLSQTENSLDVRVMEKDRREKDQLPDP